MNIEKLNQAALLAQNLRNYERIKQMVDKDQNLYSIVSNASDYLGEKKVDELLKPFKDLILKLIDEKGKEIKDKIAKL